MNKKEVATYIIIDSAIFIKKTIKRTSYFGIKYLSAFTLIASGLLIGDSFIHKDVYDQHNISSVDLLKNNNKFMIEKPINLLPNALGEEENINVPHVRYSYVPIVAEFSEKNTYNHITPEELSTLNYTLADKYTEICKTGLVSRLICFKYDKYTEIEKLKN